MSHTWGFLPDTAFVWQSRQSPTSWSQPQCGTVSPSCPTPHGWAWPRCGSKTRLQSHHKHSSLWQYIHAFLQLVFKDPEHYCACTRLQKIHTMLTLLCILRAFAPFSWLASTIRQNLSLIRSNYECVTHKISMQCGVSLLTTQLEEPSQMSTIVNMHCGLISIRC